MSWYESCTVHFSWVKHGEKIGRNYAEQVIEKTYNMNADALVYGVQTGGYVCYNSKVSPRNPYLDEDVDILRILIEKGHEKGIKIVPMLCETNMGCCALEARAHPDWLQCSADGQLKEPPWLCVNSPFRNYHFAQIRELFTNYEVDGIFLDVLYNSCWCKYCKEKFRNQYGGDMPTEPDDPRVKKFREDSSIEYIRRIRKIINEIRPSVAYEQKTSFLSYAGIEKASEDVDILRPVSHFGIGDWLIRDHALYDQLHMAYGGRPVWRCMGHMGHHAKVPPIPEIMVLAFEAFLNKTSIDLVELGRYDFGGRGLKEVGEAFGHIRELREYVLGAEPLRYCALLHTKAEDCGVLNENVRGIYHLLTENHVPLQVLSERNIKDGNLSKFKVLVIPDAVSLYDETVKKIENFVEGGGGLVMAYQTGLIEPLASLAGFHPVGLTAWSEVRIPVAVDLRGGYFNYFKVRKESSIAEELKDYVFAFAGNFLEGEYEPDCQKVADILDYDQAKVNMPFFNRRGLFPGERLTPLLTVRRVGQGAVAYFSPEVGVAAWRMGGNVRGCSPELGELIVDAVKWAGGDLPINTKNIPESVDLAVYYDSEKMTYTIILVNLTTNQFTPIKRVKYVVPLANLRLTIEHPDADLKKVVAVTGNKLECNIKNNQISLNIPKLNFYEGVIVRMK